MGVLNLEQWPLSGLTTTAVVTLTAYFLLYQLQTRKRHKDEPPILPTAVPFVGHILGMVLYGGRYVKNIGIRNPDKPIFTLPVPNSRIYVVTDPALAAAVQRASKALSFTPIIPDVVQRILGLDDRTVAIVRQNLDPEPGEPRGFLADMHDMVYGYLGPGESLNELTLASARELCRRVNDCSASLQQQEQGPTTTVDLLVWVRHFVTTATAHFLYGPQNPFAVHPELEDAFWDFDHGLGGLLLGVLPSVTAGRAYRGREALVRALTEYIEAGHHHQGDDGSVASIIPRRLAIAERYGWTAENIAREELSFLFAGIVNTATTTFWLVLQIFARPDLLAAVRKELEPAVKEEEGEGGTADSTLALHLDTVKSRCPTLLAVFREVLRLGSDNNSTRLVKADTLLAGRWHLSAGSVVQVAGGVIHADRAIWGDDSADFNPARFLRLQQPAPAFTPGLPPAKEAVSPLDGTTGTNGTTTAASPKVSGPTQVHPAAFRAFGGGKTLCPGRHFATHEILALTAMLVLTFDIEAPADLGLSSSSSPHNSNGTTIRVPPKDDGVLPVHVLEPRARDAVRVVVKPRFGKATRPLRIVG